jgi:hypothetical protein
VSFLTHFFADNTKLAEELARDEQLLAKSLERYFDAFRTKQDALADLKTGKGMRQLLPAFRLALADEYALLKSGEKTEKELIGEAEAFHKDSGSEELRKLGLTMNHATSQERYAYNLMKQLYALLLQQAATLAAIEKDPDDHALQDAFIGQLDAERRIAGELQRMDDIRGIYRRLALGERRKHELEDEERIIADEVYERMLDYEIVENGKLKPVSRNAISWLTAHCFNRLEDEVMRQVNDGTLAQHAHVMYEFVNSDLFEQFVLREINVNNVTEMNDKNLIRLFLTIFRDLYNTRIENDMY